MYELHLEGMRFTLKVLVPYDAEWIDAFREIIGSAAEVVQSSRNLESMLEHGHDAVVIASGRVPGEYIRAAPNLRMIQAFGAGIDKIDNDAVFEKKDLVVCNSHVNAAEVAEYTIMLLLSAAKNIIVNDRELRKGDWKYSWGGPVPNIELRNKTCLIIGLGNIGTEIAKRLKVFGVTIKAATRTGSSENEYVDDIAPISSVEPLVRDADFIILALPLTNESQGLIDVEFISWMKSSSIFINISRGPIVDEAALFNALKDGQIQAAAIDVWWTYPKIWGSSGNYPSDRFPFHELDNVVISPHRAAYSENIMLDQVGFAAENILRFLRGEKPLNIIDMTLGY